MSIDASPSTPPPPSTDQLLSYASAHPAATLEATGSTFRDQDLLIALNGITLPERCLLCGQSTTSPSVPLTFTWDASFTLTRESTLQLRQKAAVRAFLCPMHYARYSSGRIVGGLGSVISFAFITLGLGLAVYSESSVVPAYTSLGIGISVAGFAGAILSMFFFTLRTRTLACKLIRENYVYLEGADPSFLDSLPPLPATTKPNAAHQPNARS